MRAELAGIGRRRELWWLALGAILIGFSLAPGTVLDKLTMLGAGVCPQRPSHSHLLAGMPLPLEARMTGIFGGFLAAVAYLWLFGGGRVARLSGRLQYSVLWGMVGVMGLDGLNATAYDLGLSALYRPDNDLRLATGLLAGLAAALLFLPVWAGQCAVPVAALRGPRDAAGLLALGVTIWLTATAGPPWAFYPLALLGVGGLVLIVALLNLLLVRAALAGGRRFAGFGDLAPYGVLAIVLAVAELLALAALRYALPGAEVA